MAEAEAARYEGRADQQLNMAARAASDAAKIAHLNLASHLATKAQLLRHADANR